MDSSLPNPRFERKFVAAGYSLEQVLALVRRHPSAFHEAYPPRVVHNVYLDTPSLSDYHDHVSGSPNRQKTRVRWYGIVNGEPLKPVLERKLRRGLMSGKATDPLPPIGRDQALSREGLQELFAQSVLPEITGLSLRFLEPSLYNRYGRHYFVSFNAHIRLTVDSDLSFGRPDHGYGRLQDVRGCYCGPIIELKYKPQYADEAGVVGNQFPFRLARCSKYVLGIDALI